MTVQTETSRSGPYAGAGTTGPFTVGFRFLANSHLRVVRTSVSLVDTTLALNTDYTVSGAGATTGTVTLATALASGEKLTIVRSVPFTQNADYVPGDAFPAESHEDALDLLTMQAQQNASGVARSLTLPVTVTGVSTELQAPQASTLIGWNSAANALQNTPLASLATEIVATTWQTDVFSGNGAQTSFVLNSNPGSTRAVLVSVGGVVQTPGINFSTAGATLTFLTGAPPAGVNNVVAQYGQSISQIGTADLSNVTGTLAIGSGGTGATTAAAARAALGAAASGANTDITSLGSLASINGGQLAGMRNLIINGNLAINQRVYVSGTATVGANQYTLDRWRVVTSGQSLVFAAAGNGNGMTAPAGGVEQVIEGTNIGGGTYVLGWTGTATATVNGTARAKGEAFTLTANTNATVRLTGGTASLVQLEPGGVVTPFEHRSIGLELALCQRYYEQLNYDSSTTLLQGSPLGAGHQGNWYFKTSKRSTPTFNILNGAWLGATGVSTFASLDKVYYTATGGTFMYIGTQTAGTSGVSATSEL